MTVRDLVLNALDTLPEDAVLDDVTGALDGLEAILR